MPDLTPADAEFRAVISRVIPTFPKTGVMPFKSTGIVVAAPVDPDETLRPEIGIFVPELETVVVWFDVPAIATVALPDADIPLIAHILGTVRDLLAEYGAENGDTVRVGLGLVSVSVQETSAVAALFEPTSANTRVRLLG